MRSSLLWQGHRYIVRGMEPMSIPGRTIELEHPETGERIKIRVDEILAGPQEERETPKP